MNHKYKIVDRKHFPKSMEKLAQELLREENVSIMRPEEEMDIRFYCDKLIKNQQLLPNEQKNLRNIADIILGAIR